MSGYLQRLASQAMNPVAPVHPVLGSVFTASKFGGEADGSHVEGDEVSSRQPESRNEFDSVRSVTGLPFSIPKPERSQTSEAVPGPKPFSTPTPEPWVRRETLQVRQTWENSSPLVTPSVSRQWEPQIRQESTGKAESMRDPASPRETEKQTDEISRATFTPLIRQDVGRHDSQEIFAREAKALAATARGNSTTSSRSAPAQREPDEIQIHIGRIEVTAVPQAPVRTVTKPSRKGMNLEEYLSRRDRRT